MSVSARIGIRRIDVAAMPAPDHWNKNARQWDLIGPPLRPAAEDIGILEREVARWQRGHQAPAPRALLLGMTPEIALMRWPPGTRLTAVDRSQAMIREVWPGAGAGHGAICARWLDLPLPDGSQDIVIGDGCFSALETSDDYRALVRSMRRVITRHGRVLMRFFIRPETAEPVASVIDDLWRGSIGNFNVFKWRLAMALHGTLDEGVRLDDIWQAWRAAIPEPEQLASRLGWPLPVIRTVDVYHGVATRYTFPTLAEVRSIVAQAFAEEACVFPGYEMGDRCPTALLVPT
jgi:Methyltransferase domain